MAKRLGIFWRFEFSVLPNHQSRLSSDPEASIAPFGQCSNRGRRQPVTQCKGSELSVSPASQAAANGPNPKRSPAIAQQRLHRSTVEPLLQAKGDKPHSIKPADAVVGAYPDITIVRLCQGPNEILRQTLFTLPITERERSLAPGEH